MIPRNLFKVFHRGLKGSTPHRSQTRRSWIRRQES
jgi:hypothetical protein